MSAAGGHDAHGSGALGKVAGWVAVATFAIIVINGGFNLLDGRNFWEGIFSGGSRSPTSFQGVSNPGRRVGYVAGAPTTARECIARGGSVVNGGMSCSGYQ